MNFFKLRGEYFFIFIIFNYHLIAWEVAFDIFDNISCNLIITYCTENHIIFIKLVNIDLLEVLQYKRLWNYATTLFIDNNLLSLSIIFLDQLWIVNILLNSIKLLKILFLLSSHFLNSILAFEVIWVYCIFYRSLIDRAFHWFMKLWDILILVVLTLPLIINSADLFKFWILACKTIFQLIALFT